MLIQARNSWELAQFVWDTLYILDKKYPYYGSFHASMKIWSDSLSYRKKTIEMLKDIGLYNSTLNLKIEDAPSGKVREKTERR